MEADLYTAWFLSSCRAEVTRLSESCNCFVTLDELSTKNTWLLLRQKSDFLQSFQIETSKKKIIYLFQQEKKLKNEVIKVVMRLIRTLNLGVRMCFITENVFQTQRTFTV